MKVLSLLVVGAAAMQFRASPFTVKHKKAAEDGKGLPGCDVDTFVRYKVMFCSGKDKIKALNDVSFNRLEADVKAFKKDGNKEEGWKAWKMDTINSNGMSVCHNELGSFAQTKSPCDYKFFAEDATGAKVEVATDAATLFGAN